MNLVSGQPHNGRYAFYLLLVMASAFFAPYIGALIHWGGKIPESMIRFPAISTPAKPGLNIPITILIGGICLGVSLLFLFPRLFGFHKPAAKAAPVEKKSIRLPPWFYLGLLLWLGALGLLGLKAAEPAWLIHWALLPLFWGFSLTLDGWVYIRKNGKSMVSRSFREFVAIGMVSISGWLVFEWLNFFVKINWYYPKALLVPHDEFLLYAVSGSSGLMPMAFEWYDLLTSFRGLRRRYGSGPKIRASQSLKMALLVISFAGLFAVAFLPNLLFFILWLAPLIILAVMLERFGIWTPFTPISKGNWSPLLLFSMTYLIQGLFLESWNYISACHQNGSILTHNPAYWAYSIPYVDFLHVFEMPIFGYLGYLPFGAYCWVWWISTAFILNIHSGYSYSPEFRHKIDVG